MSLATATRSETTKQFTTSMWWILAIVLVAYVAFTAAVLGFVFSAGATGALPGKAPQIPRRVFRRCCTAPRRPSATSSRSSSAR